MIKRKRYYYMDFLAIISCFAVVVLHTSAAPGNENIDLRAFHSSSVIIALINILFSFAVPVFFMQSGANVLNYRERYDTKTFAKKRINKVVIPFIIWSILGFIFITKAPLNLLWLPSLIKGFIGGSIVGPYWFFYNIIGFYLCVPFLSLIVNKEHVKIVRYILMLTIIFNTILPMVFQIVKVNSMIVGSLPAIGSYLEYFIAGWYIVHVEISDKLTRQIYTLGIIMLAFEIFATIYGTFFMPHNLANFSYAFDYLVKTFYDISNFPSFCVMVALFLFFKNREKFFVEKNWYQWLPKLSKLTFGVYLIHPFFVAKLLPHLIVVTENWNFMLKVVMYPIIIFLVSAIVTIFFGKIPLLKKIVP